MQDEWKPETVRNLLCLRSDLTPDSRRHGRRGRQRADFLQFDMEGSAEERFLYDIRMSTGCRAPTASRLRSISSWLAELDCTVGSIVSHIDFSAPERTVELRSSASVAVPAEIAVSSNFGLVRFKGRLRTTGYRHFLKKLPNVA